MGSGREKFPHIFSKGKFGKFETKNRVKYAACCVSNYNNPDGSLTEREFARDEVISRMGCGIFTNQGAYPDKSGVGKGYTTQLCLNDDRFIPDIAGIDRENVISAWEVLEGNVETADTVAIIGGDKVGLVTAEHLASRRKEVWVVESQKRVDYDVSTTFRWRHAAWVKEFGVNVLNLTKVLEVTDKGLRVKDEKGKQRLIEAGTIILAGPRKSVQDLASSLEYVCDELYVIGDAIQPRFMHRAIHEGYKLGARL